MKKINLLFTFLLFFLYGIAQERVVLDGDSYLIDTLSHYNVGPGTQYTSLSLKKDGAPLKVFVLEIDSQNPHLKFEAVTSNDSIRGTERPSTMAKRKTKSGATFFAGTNGDFYNTSAPNVGVPINGFMTGGEVGRAPITSRAAVAFTSGNNVIMRPMQFSGTVTVNGGESLNISHVNDTRGDNQLVFFNSIKGQNTGTNSYGTEVLISIPNNEWSVNKGILKAKVLAKYTGVGSNAIPKGQAILSGHGTAQVFLEKLSVDDEIDLDLKMTYPYDSDQLLQFSELVGGDQLMIKNGAHTSYNWAERHPRTAIGYSQDKSKIYMVVVDGRSSISVGVTSKQLGDLMLFCGAYDALNLDGGGSSCMYVKEYGQVNYPSDGTERAVGNALFAVSTAPDDDVVNILRFQDYKLEVPAYAKMKPTILGYNQYGVLINTDVAASFSCSSDLGEINEKGEFVASGSANEGVLKASFNGVEVSQRVVINRNPSIAFKLDTVLVNNLKEYAIEVIGTVNTKSYYIDPLALNWTIEDPTVCQIVNGHLSGILDGSTKVVGKMGDFSDTLYAVSQTVSANPFVQEKFEDTSSFTLTGSSTIKSLALTNSDIPSSWSHGGKISYTYTSGRLSQFTLSKPMALYSLPDTISVTLNMNNVSLNRALLFLRPNNETLNRSVELTVTAGKDMVSTFIMSDFLPDATDFSSYPIYFDKIVFYLNDGGHTNNTDYQFYLKDVKLGYENVNVSIDEHSIVSDDYIIYPNPIRRGEFVTIKLKNSLDSKVTVYSLLGQVLYQSTFSKQNTIVLPTGAFAEGTHLFKVEQGGSVTVKKILIK